MKPIEGSHYTPSPVELENVVGAWSAANTRGGLALAGGQVVLTAQYVVFTPWDMAQTRAWLVKGLSTAGSQYAGQIDKLITASRLLEPVAIPLNAITSVQPLNAARLFKPPTARLELMDGRHFDLGILASPTTPSVSRKNNAAMQDFMSRLHLLLGR
jgi:hypothetical protein